MSIEQFSNNNLPNAGRYTPHRATLIGVSAIALAAAFNIPYAVLAATFDYPGILRRPAEEILTRFSAGGAGLVLSWYGFMLSALALVPLAPALSVTPDRLRYRPALAVGAAIAGAMAGLAQAIGLSRWVFAVPSLAAAPGDASSAALVTLGNFAGNAIGEHLGQLLTALFIGQLAALQLAEGGKRTAWLGFASAIAMAVGTGEGLALALGQDGALFSTLTIAGFLGLTGWLIATGIGLLRRR